MPYIEVQFKKPLWINRHGAYIRLRNTYIDRAIQQGKKLRISIPGLGSAIHDPYDWLKTGQRTEQVFLRPDEPIVLIGNYVKIDLFQEKLPSLD